MSVETLNWLLGIGTIGMQVLSVGLILAHLWRDKSPLARDIIRFATQWGLWGAFWLSLAGVGLTLYYSEVIGYVPCGLCWLTRVFFYPQVLLFAVALYKQEGARVADYSIALSIPGAVIALYKHYLELGGSELLPCPASGVGDCGKRYIFEFGYVTMPMMGFSLLVLLIVLMVILKRRD
jgi:disulfide bond formation protein DsbB